MPLEVIERALEIFIVQALMTTLGLVLISLPALLLLLVGYVQIRRKRIGLPHHFFVFLLAVFLFPVGEFLIGSAAYDTDSEIATNVSSLLLGLSFLFTVATTVRAKGRRLFVFGVGCAFTIWTFWAWFLTQMSIANSWL